MADRTCYWNNGTSFRFVSDSYTPIDDEILTDGLQSADQLAHLFPGYNTAANEIAIENQNRPILKQLSDIDIKKTRAITDAILTGSNTRLIQLESEAAALRSQIVK